MEKQSSGVALIKYWLVEGFWGVFLFFRGHSFGFFRRLSNQSGCTIYCSVGVGHCLGFFTSTMDIAGKQLHVRKLDGYFVVIIRLLEQSLLSGDTCILLR
jgi:hypothetical protein